MTRFMVMAACLAAVSAFVACGDNGAPQPTAEPTQTILPTATDVPSGALTGIPELDAVLGALFSGDEDAIRSLVRFTPTACEKQPAGLGSPPQCLGDEPDGTFVDVYLHGYCEGVYIRPEDMAVRYLSLATPGASIYAVYRHPEQLWPPGEFVAVYTDSLAEPAPVNVRSVFITDGRIVGSFSGCGGTPEDYIASWKLDQRVLFVGSRGLTGDSELDALAEAFQLHDADVLRRFVELQAVPCITTPEGIGGPPLCREDEPLGTQVAVLPTSTCEPGYVRDDELDMTLQAIAEADLYAVYAQRTESAEFVMILSREAPESDVAIEVAIKNGRITSVNFTCVLTPEEALAKVPPDDVFVGPLQP
ncbi:MAG: hypothetical protein J4N95_03895 [Chloroflexi bacterium]|nr:hypothetical protein [Chloroflexota bacterium]MCI0889788.1 hypothetical protein [Chloroflexota bacterium]